MAVAPTEIRTLARSYTKAAIKTLVGIMRQPKAPPAARVMAANALLDRGWGKAAQLVAVDGEIRQLVEVKLSVVEPKAIGDVTTKLLTNHEKSNDINAVDLSARRIPAALLSENIKPEMPLPAGLWGQRIEETHALHRLRTSDSLLPCFSSHSRVVICLGMPPHHITNPTTQPFVRCERISSPASRRPGPQRATAMFFPHFVGDACFYDS
jgi:hypothetical protein